MTKLEYLRRFTQEERISIRTAAASNAVLADYMAMLELATDIDLSDSDTVSALAMLEQVGLIGAGRAAEILSTNPEAPSSEPAKFVVTHRVDGVDAMVDQDGTVRYTDGKWTTIDTLAALGKAVEAI